MEYTLKTLVATMLAAAAISAGAAPQEVAPDGFAQARQQFKAAAGGDSKASDAAIAAFSALAAANPSHPLLAAYEGAATAMKGRDAMMPWDKLKYAEKGANAIEKALAQLTPEHDEALFNGTPESIEIRLVAANTLLSLPGFMNRGAGGKRAVQAAIDSKVFGQASPQVRASLLNAAASIAANEKRGADEIAYLRQLAAITPAGKYSTAAEARLKELGQ
ncbi:hypothetical protein [Pseudoduganella violacea]|uniref:Spy/CpxP family protein refolding chaperone n=1 Tax=Pseudoduganella violacea TaxID=1715466 RepID=A0A7W5B9A0_9BURK|nr:hypothetical protein [Pseudoduganella violacea]MBB3118773.1 Spy/CpxP family protein refolding chaperone [Pseudoduganella violacea]